MIGGTSYCSRIVVGLSKFNIVDSRITVPVDDWIYDWYYEYAPYHILQIVRYLSSDSRAIILLRAFLFQILSEILSNISAILSDKYSSNNTQWNTTYFYCFGGPLKKRMEKTSIDLIRPDPSSSMIFDAWGHTFRLTVQWTVLEYFPSAGDSIPSPVGWCGVQFRDIIYIIYICILYIYNCIYILILQK